MPKEKSNRRDFIHKSSVVAGGLLLGPQWLLEASSIAQETNPLFKGRDAKERLKVGLIGVGLRGTNHLNNLLQREDVEIVALSDIDPKRIELCLALIEEAKKPRPKVFSKHETDYLNLLSMTDLEAVIISTPWQWHARMALDSMEAGKYTGLEVSAAVTMEECWDLVDTHERTGSHLMILENVNYRRDIMAVLHMVRKGLFGELIHLRCGYQHDLRHVKFNDGKTAYGLGAEFGEKGISESKWRTQYSLDHNADVYPTHGLGPVAVMTDINRGNRFVSLTSHASKSRGLHNYVEKVGGKDHPNAQLTFRLGDVITTTLTTERGETILITHDTNLPRPYSLGFRVQGTSGLWEVDGNRIYLEDEMEAHKWSPDQPWLERYDHPLWQEFGTYASGAGHGGMDFFVLKAFVEAAKAGTAPPLDVYDAASWSAVTPLSGQSIAEGGSLQEFPDFTRGKWKERSPYPWI